MDSAPVFTFPESIQRPRDVVVVSHIEQLRHFSGWTVDQLPGCAPILAVARDGCAVSICFSARLAAAAAEAGVETAESFRGRGFGPRVTAAWALAVRESCRLRLYSTSWANASSLAVAKKLGLRLSGSDWNVW